MVECVRRESAPLAAVLLNPPSLTTGVRTRNAVERAAAALGYGAVEIVNLCSFPTRSAKDLEDLEEQGWTMARTEIEGVLKRSSAVLGAWGVAGLTGGARVFRDQQVDWLYTEALSSGFSSIWMVGAEPRHPSRWHQYLSDKYGRTAGGPPIERLKQALVAVAIAECPRRSVRRIMCE